MDAKAWIEANGDYAEVARKLGKPEGTVAAWKSRSAIPRTVWPDLLEVFRKTRLADLREMERA